MSLSDNYTPLRQLGNGVTTAFSPGWKALNEDYLRVYKEAVSTGVRTLMVINTDYTVAVDSTGLATVTYLVAPTSSQYAFIDRDVTQSQESPYKTAKGFQGEVLEQSFDKLTAMVQDVSVRVDAAILAPSGDSGLVLPDAAARANTYLHFDTNGDVELTANAVADGTYSDIIVSGDGAAWDIVAGAVGNTEVASGIDAVKLADGSVSNAEFQYLNGVTSAIQTQLDGKVDENSSITGATKTKITYDAKGLVTSGADATTADIAASTDKNYVTDAQLVVIGNTSGTNTGDQNLFGTIAVSGQSDVVADSTSDTLTLAAGSNVTLTTNAGTDTITISASGGSGGTPGGSDTQLQYNNAGAFGGITGATSNGTSVTLTSPTFITPALGTPASGVATNLTGTASGLTAGTATVANTVSTANEATDTTCFPLFVTASGTQSLQPKNNTSLTFNSNTGALSATTFNGVALTTAGSASNFLNAAGSYTAVTASGGFPLTSQSTAINLGTSQNATTQELTGSTSRTWTFTAAATLGSSWSCILANNSTAELTLDPNGGELIDGLATFKMYPGEKRLVCCTGTAFTSFVLHPFYLTVAQAASPFTFTKPPGYNSFGVRLGGAGGSGGKSSSAGAGGGGGGGSTFEGSILASAVGTTETLTIGAGGAAQTTASSNGNAGNNTTFGSLATAYGGGRGGGAAASSCSGGGGAGLLAVGGDATGATAGAGGAPCGGAAPVTGDGVGYGGAGGGSGGDGDGKVGGPGGFSGGGGGAGTTGAGTGVGGAAFTGGGGGGGAGSSTSGAAGGASKLGGNGGAGGFDANNATDGAAGTNGYAGGGGGGSETGTSGAGGNGSAAIWGIA